MTTPHLGQIVLYRHDSGVDLPALIVGVPASGGDSVNLLIFHNGPLTQGPAGTSQTHHLTGRKDTEWLGSVPMAGPGVLASGLWRPLPDPEAESPQALLSRHADRGSGQ